MSDRLPLLSVFMNIQQDKSGKGRGRTQTNVRLNKVMAGGGGRERETAFLSQEM